MEDSDPPRKQLKMSEFSWALNESDFQTALLDLEDSLPEELLFGYASTSAASTSQGPPARWSGSPTTQAPSFHDPRVTAVPPPPYARVIQNPTFTPMQPFPPLASQQQRAPKRPHPASPASANRHISVISQAAAGTSHPEASSCCPQQQLAGLYGPATPSMTFAAGIRQRLDLAKRSLPRSNFVQMLGELKDVMGNIRVTGREDQPNRLLNSYLAQVVSLPSLNPAEGNCPAPSAAGPSRIVRTPQEPVLIELDSSPPPTPPLRVAPLPAMQTPAPVPPAEAAGPTPSNPGEGSRPGGNAPPGSKLRMLQQQLVLLMHAQRCEKGAQCPVPKCPSMRKVVEHMASCRPTGAICSFPYCVSSQQIVQHWKTCNKLDCPLCGMLRREDKKTLLADIVGTLTGGSTKVEKTVTPSVSEKGPLKDSEGRTCIVCMEQEITHAIVPCGHTLCGDCGQALQKAGTICHVCRGPIHKFFRIYLQ